MTYTTYIYLVDYQNYQYSIFFLVNFLLDEFIIGGIIL